MPIGKVVWTVLLALAIGASVKSEILGGLGFGRFETAAGMLRPYLFASRGVPIATTLTFGASPSIAVSGGHVRFGPDTDGLISSAIAAIDEDARKIVTIAGADFVVAASRSDGPANISDALAPALAVVAGKGFDTLNVEDGTVVLSRAIGGDLVLAGFDATFTMAPGKRALTGSGRFLLTGEPVDFDLSIGLEVVGAAGERPSQLTLRSSYFSLTIDGSSVYESALEQKGAIDLRIADVRRFARWQGVELGGTFGLRSFAASGAYALSTGLARIDDARVSIDGNSGVGGLSLRLDRPRPKIDGTLAFGQLDLTALAREPLLLAPDRSEQPGSLTLRRLVLPLVEEVDVDLRVSADSFVADELRTGRGALTLTLLDGRFNADVAELELFGGTASGSIEMVETGGRSVLKLRGRSTELRIEPLLRAIGRSSPLWGELTASIEVEGGGATIGDMLATLDGTVEGLLTGGGIAEGPISHAMAALDGKTAPGPGPLAGPAAFSELTGTVRFSHGIASVSSLTIRGAAGETLVTGSVDLTSRGLALRLEHGAGPGERRSVVRLTGPWDKPEVVAESTTTAMP